MADNQWSRGQAVGNRRDVLNEVSDRTQPHRLLCGALSMAAQPHSQRSIALRRKEVQEMLVPAPGAMPGTVDKEQRRFLRLTGGPLIDHIRHEPDSSAGCRFDAAEPSLNGSCTRWSCRRFPPKPMRFCRTPRSIATRWWWPIGGTFTSAPSVARR